MKQPGPSSLHNQFTFDHIHCAGEGEFALAGGELDRDLLIKRKLAVDLVLFDHNLFRAGRVSLSPKGHFGGHAGFEFEIGRLEPLSVTSTVAVCASFCSAVSAAASGASPNADDSAMAPTSSRMDTIMALLRIVFLFIDFEFVIRLSNFVQPPPPLPSLTLP